MTYKLYTAGSYWKKQSLRWLGLTLRSIFLQPSVQKAWWRTHGKPDLRILEVEEDGKLIGVVPLCSFDEGKTLQFLGDQDVSDDLDWIVANGKERQVADAFREFLRSDTVWQRVNLISVSHISTIFTNLNERYFIKTQQDVSPVISLPKTWPEYLQNVGKKQRNEVRRKWKRLEEHGNATFRVISNISQDLTSLETFIHLHKKSSPEKAAFWTKEHTEYFEALTLAVSKGGWLRLYFLDIDGEPAATMYCFEYGDSLLVYNSGFDAEKFSQLSPGQVLIAYTVQDAIARGKKFYNFLRGGEEYKLRYGAKPEPVFNVTINRDQVTF